VFLEWWIACWAFIISILFIRCTVNRFTNTVSANKCTLLYTCIIHLTGSSVGIATRYWMDGPGIESRCGARFSVPVQTGPGAHPASYSMGTGSFPEVKRPGRGVDHPPPSSAEVKERAELYLYFSGSSWTVLRWPLPLPLQLTLLLMLITF